jgi:hypothetical protein
LKIARNPDIATTHLSTDPAFFQLLENSYARVLRRPLPSGLGGDNDYVRCSDIHLGR